MERVPVQSSNVAEVGYDQDALVMEVLFHNGSVYQYFDVPQMLFQEMLQSDSIGGFLNEHIKGSYRYAKL